MTHKEKGMNYARDNNLFHELCHKMVESAIEILEEMQNKK